VTTHLEIENISADNQKSLFRSQRIKLGGKVATTPFRSLDPSKFRSAIPLNKNAFGFNELYRELDSQKITSLQHDSGELDQFTRGLKNASNRGQRNDLTTCLIKFVSKQTSPFPNTKEIEFIIDVEDNYSDMIAIPMVEARIDESNFSSYIKYLETSYNVIEELNTKPIMGALPNLSRELYPKLLKFLLDKDIIAFYFDFNGRTPDHLMLRPILRYLNKEKILRRTLIYGINPKVGRSLKNATIVLSKDFIAFGFGLDVLGESHIRPKFPKIFFEKMKMAIHQQQQNKKRIFIKSDYGYYQTNMQELESVYPDDTRIMLTNIIRDPRKTWQKLFNMEQQALEASEIRKRLGELKSNDTILDYIKDKSQVVKEIKQLELSVKGVSNE
jgi:hypothetical protein